MKSPLCRLLRDELGQDFVEYTLLLAFVAVCSAAVLVLQGGSFTTIWQVANSNLSAGQQAAGS